MQDGDTGHFYASSRHYPGSYRRPNVIFVNVECGHYQIISPSGMVVANITKSLDWSRPVRIIRFGQPDYVAKRIWKVVWRELKDEYGDYTNPPECFDTLHDIHCKYRFANFPGFGHVLKKK